MATTTTASTTSPTTPALFRFTIHSTKETTHLHHTHPIPTFLCSPSPSQKASPAFTTAFIDCLSLITSQHHDQCMTSLHGTTCLSCASPTTDCLKSPSPYLDLADPLVIISVYPICNSQHCANVVRRHLLRLQQAGSEREREEEEEQAKIYGKMDCKTCGKEGAMRCKGCGTVAYCGKECQSLGWKKHRRECGGGYKSKKKREEEGQGGMKVPYETI